MALKISVTQCVFVCVCKFKGPTCMIYNNLHSESKYNIHKHVFIIISQPQHTGFYKFNIRYFLALIWVSTHVC